MPIYEYRCRQCGKITEALVRIGENAKVACAKCGSTETERKLSTFGMGGSSSGTTSDSCTGFT
jgi:putative FmdB family regulatory protein